MEKSGFITYGKSTGTVTTAALWDIPGIYKEHSIHIATYSIAQLLAALPTSMTNSVVIHYRNKPTKLFDFIANWSNQKYALIHLATNTIPQAFSIFTEFDYNLQSITGAMNANYNNSDIFHRGLQSIDTYNNYSQYVMGGIYSKQNNILTYNVETSEQPSLCQPNLECSIDTCTKIQATINPHGLSTIGGYKTISNIPRYDSIMKTIMIECEMLNE